MNHTDSRRGLAAAALACALALPIPQSAEAVVGTFDQAPAATLLLPYFEVDLADPNGPQTRFTVSNFDPEPVLAKVTLWTNVGVPTFNFDVYLEGRDSLEIDLRLVFKGVIPQTGPGQVELGALSDPSVNFPACVGGSNSATGVSLPIPDQLSAAQIEHLAAAHTGRPSATFGNLCAAENLGDEIARGYVTVDTVNECSIMMPPDPGYFVSGGVGVASNRNALFGTFSLIERGWQARATSSPLVHLEADSASPLTSVPGAYTFYSSYVAATAADNRESAGSVWQLRQIGSTMLQAETDLIVWRDAGGRDPVPFSSPGCAAAPAPFPLGHHGILSFDEAENPYFPGMDDPFPNPPPPVPPLSFRAAQRMAVSEFSPFDSGWTILNLNSPGTPAGSLPIYGAGIRQSVVLSRVRQGGQASPFLPATLSAMPWHQAERVDPVQCDFWPNDTCTGGPEFCNAPDNCNGFTSASGFW